MKKGTFEILKVGALRVATRIQVPSEGLERTDNIPRNNFRYYFIEPRRGLIGGILIYGKKETLNKKEEIVFDWPEPSRKK